VTAPTLPTRRDPVPSDRERAAGTERRTALPVGPLPTQDAVAAPSARITLRSLINDARLRLPPGLTARFANVLGLTSLGRAAAAAVLGASYLKIAQDTGTSDRVLILLGNVTLIGAILFGQAFAYLADRVNRVRLLAAATVVFGLGTLALGLSQTIAAFVVTKFTQDLLGGFQTSTAPTTSLLSDQYPPEVRGHVIARESSIGTIAAIIMAPLGGLAANIFGYGHAILATAFISGGSALVYLLLKEPERGRWDRLRAGASEQVAARVEAKPTLAEAWRATRSVRTLRRVCYAQAFLGAGGITLTPVLLLVRRDVFGVNPAIVGAITGGGLVFVLLGINAAGVLSDRILRDRPARIMTLLGAVLLGNVALLFVLVFVHTPFVVVPVVLAQSFFSQLPNTGRDVLVSQVTPARLRTFGIQLPNLFGLLGLVASPFAVLFAGTTAVTSVLVFASVFLIIAALIYMTAAVDVGKDMESARLAAVAAEEGSRLVDGKQVLLVCRGVDLAYDGVQVLFGVDFDCVEGELVALLGTNGAGKSSLLRAISGLTEPVGGAVFFDGRDVTHMPAHEVAQLGVVQMPGGKGVFPTMTVAENLRTAGWLHPGDLAGRMDRVYDVFPRLRERADVLAGALSGGEQQMVALGQAFVMRPRILLIDELSLGLAPAVVEELLQAVTALRADGMTVIMVEQSVDLALTVATRAVFMEKGEVCFSGSSEELRARPDLLRSIYLKGTRSGVVRSGGDTRTGRDDAGTVLEARDVSVSYGGVRALDGASLAVRAGEVVGLIGPNGAGKTTLFDVLSGFVPPAAGTVTLAGRDVTGLGPRQRAALGLARSFQDARLFPALSVLDNVCVALQADASSPTEVLAALWLPGQRNAERTLARKAEALVEQFGLADLRDAAPSELSTGQRRVLDLACQVAASPDVLLLDEPSSGIAQAEAEELGPLIDGVRRELGCGVLIIEHDVALLASVADRMVGMVLGRTIVEGSYAEVSSDPVMVEAYLGRSSRVLARSRVT